MEVKIGVQSVAREIAVETDMTADAVEQALVAALSAAHGILSITNRHGQRVLVPAEKIGYVEIGESESRRVGFGAL